MVKLLKTEKILKATRKEIHVTYKEQKGFKLTSQQKNTEMRGQENANF